RRGDAWRARGADGAERLGQVDAAQVDRARRGADFGRDPFRRRASARLAGAKLSRDWPPKEYARQLDSLPQEPEPAFPMRAIDVVVSGRAPFLGRFERESRADYAEAERALLLCDAAHLADRLLEEMSGGER